MNFYSGFCLKEESKLFLEWIDQSDFALGGFSLGAIKAFEAAFETTSRIDKLQLFSPAFFQNREKKFLRMQELYYQKDRDAYIKTFLKNISSPSSFKMHSYYHDSGKEQGAKELHKLLHYQWDAERISILRDRGIDIEVYLGSEDQIIDAKATKAFFLPFAEVITIKGAGHILQI